MPFATVLKLTFFFNVLFIIPEIRADKRIKRRLTPLRRRNIISVMIFKIPAHVVWRRLGDEAVLLNLRNDTYYSLNSTGADMLEKLLETRQADMARDLALEYDVEEKDIQSDLQSLVDELTSQELLIPCEN